MLVDAGRVLAGASGNSSSVKKSRTFSGALCSENQDVPGSESSSASESESESFSESSFSGFWVVVSGSEGCWFLVERWERVRA